MYYLYKCTYCSRQFYAYDTNRENASKTLYRSVKQHLIDYNEDHKEYQMDDGEQADSNQIYNEMVESNQRPAGGYEATQTAPVNTGNSTSSGGGGTSYSSAATLIILVIIIAFVALLFLFPEVMSIFK